MRRSDAARSTILASVVLISGSCVASLEPPATHAAEEFTRGRELYDLELLPGLREAAEAEPEALEPQWKAGMAHVRATLRGHVDQRDHAERYLERAWRLDPTSERVPAARVLARFLNMRSSVLDLGKLDLQLELYRALLEQTGSGAQPLLGSPLAGVEETDARRFHFASFHAAAEALARYAAGDTLAALRKLNELERAMRLRAAGHPEDIDTCAMAGNFELTFAGVVPVGVDKRLRRGIDYLEIQQDNWEQLSPRARSTGVAPNVRSVFALYLAEALLAYGDLEAAAARYEQLIGLAGQPDTAVRQQILALAEHRLAHLDDYAGARELLPPWPAGVSSCVACHADEATLPIDDLHLLPGITSIGPEVPR
jgi:tetratricopeptide (TPR) repeat protein